MNNDEKILNKLIPNIVKKLFNNVLDISIDKILKLLIALIPSIILLIYNNINKINTLTPILNTVLVFIISFVSVWLICIIFSLIINWKNSLYNYIKKLRKTHIKEYTVLYLFYLDNSLKISYRKIPRKYINLLEKRSLIIKNNINNYTIEISIDLFETISNLEKKKPTKNLDSKIIELYENSLQFDSELEVVTFNYEMNNENIVF